MLNSLFVCYAIPSKNFDSTEGFISQEMKGSECYDDVRSKQIL